MDLRFGEKEEALVFVSASLTDAMERLGRDFTEAEGTRVIFNVGGSGSLAQQIIRGAPADVFISAGDQPMDVLQDRDMLVPGTRSVLLPNELILVTREGGTRLGSVDELATADVRVAVADPELAPAGAYAREALRSMDLWDALGSRLILGQDVRVTLGYLKTGNIDAAIVYRTDVREGQGFDVVTSFPAGSHTPIVYPAAVLSRSSHQDAAVAFLGYLSGERGRQVLRDFGFVPLERE